MAAFFLDHNHGPQIARLLREHGHMVVLAREWQLTTAGDAENLRIAASQNLILVSENRDYLVLHESYPTPHAGILIVPQASRHHAAEIVNALRAVVTSGLPLADELYLWHREGGWVRYPSPKNR